LVLFFKKELLAYFAEAARKLVEVDPKSGQQTVLYAFTGGDDSSGPTAPLIYHDGAFYGSTDGEGAPLLNSRRERNSLSLVDKIIRESPAPSGEGEQESSSFLKKRTKKLLLCWLTRPATLLRTVERKVFWFFFSKKNCFLRACFPLQAARFIPI